MWKCWLGAYLQLRAEEAAVGGTGIEAESGIEADDELRAIRRMWNDGQEEEEEEEEEEQRQVDYGRHDDQFSASIQ